MDMKIVKKLDSIASLDVTLIFSIRGFGIKIFNIYLVAYGRIITEMSKFMFICIGNTVK